MPTGSTPRATKQNPLLEDQGIARGWQDSRGGRQEGATLESEQRYSRLLASVTDYVQAVLVQDGRGWGRFTART